jgi:uncharacterized membrane protein SpoIIM required for sporulation
MAKDIFLGTVGAMLGLFICAVIGHAVDPKNEYKDVWAWILPAFVIAGSSGLIWLGTII